MKSSGLNNSEKNEEKRSVGLTSRLTRNIRKARDIVRVVVSHDHRIATTRVIKSLHKFE